MVKAESHQTRGLQPLGLTHTIFPTTAAMPSPHPHGYSVQGGPLTEANTATNTSVEWTAGAMISTLDDLHTWAQALATGRVLSSALQKQPLTLSPPSVANFRHHGVAAGYGLAIAKVYGFIGLNGGLPGFTTDAWYLPALQATIVVIVNSDAAVQEQALADPADYLFTRLAACGLSARVIGAEGCPRTSALALHLKDPREWSSPTGGWSSPGAIRTRDEPRPQIIALKSIFDVHPRCMLSAHCWRKQEIPIGSLCLWLQLNGTVGISPSRHLYAFLGSWRRPKVLLSHIVAGTYTHRIIP